MQISSSKFHFFNAQNVKIDTSRASVVSHQPIFSNESLNISNAKGQIPANHIFFREPFDVIEEGKKNSTKGFSKANMPVSIKDALEPSLKLLDKVEPEIAKGLRNLDEHDIELTDDGLTSFFQKNEIYAAWVAVAREGMQFHFSDMILDDNFWGLTDAEKASVLLHEYVHAKEIPIISHFEKLFGTLKSLVTKEYGDGVEDRAYLRQYDSFKKLGIENGEIYWTVRSYLEDRNLWPETES